jgi:5-carboxymethyl-2-hydroxymuconate isomerase
MPHIIVEYSANLADHLDLRRLVNDPHQAAIDSGVAELVGIPRAPCELPCTEAQSGRA